jgi:transcriptional regulator with XRE-family HTH domain
MHKLKDLRTRLRLTQKQLAEMLKTTQQTVARWESGQTEIPVAHLKDIAILFGRSVDELLGIGRGPHQRKAEALAQADHEAPFGTLAVKFGFGVREYPIDEKEQGRLVDAFRKFTLSENKDWMEFTALDNRLVYCKLGAVTELHFISDDAEGTPFYVSPETYRSLTAHTRQDQVGPVVAGEREELAARLAPSETDPKKALEAAEASMRSLRVIFTDGREETFYFSDVATSIFILQNNLGDVGPNAFLSVEEHGDHVIKLVNLTNVAVIEVPLEAYLDEVADDFDDRDVEALKRNEGQEATTN